MPKEVKIDKSHLEFEENPLKTFVDELVKKTNITLPEEEMFFYKQRLVNLLQRRLGLVSLNNLDSKAMADYVKLTKRKPTERQMEKFFADHIPNYKEVVTKALDDFARDFFASLK